MNTVSNNTFKYSQIIQIWILVKSDIPLETPPRGNPVLVAGHSSSPHVGPAAVCVPLHQGKSWSCLNVKWM